MRARTTGYLALAFSLLGTVELVRPACARETRGVPALPHAALAGVLPEVGAAAGTTPLPAITDPALVQAAVVATEGSGTSSGLAVRGSASSAGSAGNTEPHVDLDATDDVKADKLCANPQCGTVHQIDLLPDVIFDKLEELPVLGLFVVPVTKGMTVDPGEGLPLVTFAVKPTKITRGSGLVAIAHF